MMLNNEYLIPIDRLKGEGIKIQNTEVIETIYISTWSSQVNDSVDNKDVSVSLEGLGTVSINKEDMDNLLDKIYINTIRKLVKELDGPSQDIITQ